MALNKSVLDMILAEVKKDANSSNILIEKIDKFNAVYDKLSINDSDSNLILSTINEVFKMSGLGDYSNKLTVDKIKSNIRKYRTAISGFLSESDVEQQMTAMIKFTDEKIVFDEKDYLRVENKQKVQEKRLKEAMSKNAFPQGEGISVDNYGKIYKESKYILSSDNEIISKTDINVGKEIEEEKVSETAKGQYDELINKIVSLSGRFSKVNGKARVDEILFKSLFKKELDEYKTDEEGYDNRKYFNDIYKRLVTEGIFAKEDENKLAGEIFTETIDHLSGLRTKSLAKIMSIAPQLDRLYQTKVKQDKRNVKIPYKDIIEAEIIKIKSKIVGIFYQHKQLASGRLAKSIEFSYRVKDKDGTNGTSKTILLMLKHDLGSSKKYARYFEYGVSAKRYSKFTEKENNRKGERLLNKFKPDGFTMGIYSWIGYKIKNGSWEGKVPKNDKERLRFAYAIRKSLLTTGLHTSKPTSPEGNKLANPHQTEKRIESGEALYMFQYLLTLLTVNINRSIDEYIITGKTSNTESDYYRSKKKVTEGFLKTAKSSAKFDKEAKEIFAKKKYNIEQILNIKKDFSAINKASINLSKQVNHFTTQINLLLGKRLSMRNMINNRKNAILFNSRKQLAIDSVNNVKQAMISRKQDTTKLDTAINKFMNIKLTSKGMAQNYFNGLEEFNSILSEFNNMLKKL